MKAEKFQVTLAEGQKELIIREGDAPKILEVKPPVKINIEGTIDAPVEFLKRRFAHSQDANTSESVMSIFNHFDHTRCHVLINREKVSITLITNEHDEYTRGIVAGKLEVHPKFKEFGINQEKSWTPNQLGQFIKMNRAFFADKSKNMALVTDLKNFHANINSIVEKQKSESGSFKDNYAATVTSNLPEGFTLDIPIFKGYEKESIYVEFYADVDGRDVYLSLVSPAASEILESLRDKCIDEKIKEIREIAPNIVIIEQ